MGMTLPELAAFFEQLGCQRAYNLDGGMSAAIVFQGERLNSPAWGGREIGDILYLSE